MMLGSSEKRKMKIILEVENLGISLFNNALGGLLGSFSSIINKRKKPQTTINRIKGTNLIIFLIF